MLELGQNTIPIKQICYVQLLFCFLSVSFSFIDDEILPFFFTFSTLHFVGRCMFILVEQVLARIINGVEKYGFSCKGWIESPLKGAEGNTEFLACFSRTSARSSNPSEADNEQSDLPTN